MNNKRTGELKKFGLILSLILSGIAIFGLFKGIESITAAVLFCCAGMIFILTIFLPKMLRYPEWLLLKIGSIMGWIVTRIILIVLFYVVVFPVSIVMKLKKEDQLTLTWDKKAASYWDKYPPEFNDPKRSQRQF